MKRTRILLAMSRNTKGSITSYARPSSIAHRSIPISPTPPFPPLKAPPDLSKPSHPQRPDIPDISGWRRTTHVLHAAYPRSFVESTGKLTRESEPYGQELPGETKEQRTERVQKGVEMSVGMRRNATLTRSGDDLPGLYMAAERWEREGRKEEDPEGITLLITHANGFMKESWHPTLRRLLKESRVDSGSFGQPALPFPLFTSPTLPQPSSSSLPSTSRHRNVQIDEIWLLDDIHHAASIDVNTGRIGPVHSWVDGGRDIIAAIKQIFPKGKSRRVIGVGHSFGGNAMVHAAHARPDLFDALFLVEPMCPPLNIPLEAPISPDNFALPYFALKRRSSWHSLEAFKSLRDTPFYQSWHDESWALWLSHGVVPSQTAGVQLATPKWAEAAVFSEFEAIGQGWDKLPELRVPVGFVMAGDPTATHGEEATREMVWRPPVSANEIVVDAGHLVVQERPDEVANCLRRFIGNVMIPMPPSAKL